MRARILVAVCGLAAVAFAFPALAGDPPAHQEAARRASVQVAQAFAQGVGTPEVNIDLNALCNGEIESCPINAPDLWGCEDSRQPAAITQANDQVLGPITAAMANELNLATPMFAGQAWPVAMTCNYNHFVQSPGLPANAQLSFAQQAMIDAARAQFTFPISSGNLSLCTQGHFDAYWILALGAAHYAQDSAAEQHAIGNRWCSASGTLDPGAAVGWIPKLIRAGVVAGLGTTGRVIDDSCGDFILSAIASAAINGALSCDAAVAPGSIATLSAACVSNLVPAACMGLERTLRHHCDWQDGRAAPRAVHCQGALDPSCNVLGANCTAPGSHTYCEGEMCTGGSGSDFLGDAVNATVPLLTQMANEWANACGCGATGEPCAAGQTCLSCGGADSCQATGNSCCGNQFCANGQECCGAGGSLSCVTAGSCCGDKVCGSSEICLDCEPPDGGTDGGTDAGSPDAGNGCVTAIDAGTVDGGPVQRQGNCVEQGTQCCDDNVCPLGCCSTYGTCAEADGGCCWPPAAKGGGHYGTCTSDDQCCAPGKCVYGECAIPYGGACESPAQCFQNDGFPSDPFNSTCASGRCCANPRNTNCTSDSDCCTVPPGMKCNVDDSGIGTCYVPTGGHCSQDSDCDFLDTNVGCTNGVCCIAGGSICVGGAQNCCSGVCGSGLYCQ